MRQEEGRSQTQRHHSESAHQPSDRQRRGHAESNQRPPRCKRVRKKGNVFEQTYNEQAYTFTQYAHQVAATASLQPLIAFGRYLRQGISARRASHRTKRNSSQQKKNFAPLNTPVLGAHRH